MSRIGPRLNTIAVVVVFAALLFLVYRDVSEHKVLSIGTPAFLAGQVATEPAGARGAVEADCAQSAPAPCGDITYIGGAPETTNTYQYAVFIVALRGTDGDEFYVRTVWLEAGEVVTVR